VIARKRWGRGWAASREFRSAIPRASRGVVHLLLSTRHELLKGGGEQSPWILQAQAGAGRGRFASLCNNMFLHLILSSPALLLPHPWLQSKMLRPVIVAAALASATAFAPTVGVAPRLRSAPASNVQMAMQPQGKVSHRLICAVCRTLLCSEHRRCYLLCTVVVVF